MIEFKSLVMQNFLSYGAVPTTIQLNRQGTILILGEDLDNTTSGSGGNGVGKTVLLNALTYALYDQPISNISKDNLVNNINKINMEVTIEFTKDQKTYRITRARKKKTGAAGNYVYLYENDKDITLDSSNNTNNLIIKILGIPYELFVRIVAFSATHTPFLDLPVRSHYAANQTDIIEELFDLKTLSEKADLLKLQIKSTETSLSMQVAHVAQLEKEHERHKKQLDSAYKRITQWQDQNKNEIIVIEKNLQRIESIDIDEQRMFYEQLNNITQHLRNTLDKQQSIEREIKSIVESKTKAEKHLSHLHDAKCPYCLQKYENNISKIQECNEIVEFSNKQLEIFTPQLYAVTNSIKELTSSIKQIKQQIVVQDLDDLVEIKSKKDQLTGKLAELKTAINPFIEPLQELESIKLEPIDNLKINELKSLIDHQQFLLKLLTKKDSFVRKTLLNKNIPFLNQRLQMYLIDLGLPHTVEFTHEMTAKISKFDREMDFGNLSNGQRARVNIALSFAFRDVLQSMHQKINVCMLDEILDVGLDAIGVQAAVRMLKRKTRDEHLSMFIISHRDEIDGAFDQKMVVQMSGGFSSIRYEDG